MNMDNNNLIVMHYKEPEHRIRMLVLHNKYQKV